MTDVDEAGVTIEVTIAAPVETVWQSLREPAWIRRWHGWHFDGLDQEIDMIYLTNVSETAERFELEIDGGDRFELTDREGGTQVRIVRAAPGGNPEWDAYYDDITEGWTSFLQQLRFALEQQPGRDRRTVFFSAEGAADPRANLGLDKQIAGAPYAVSDPSSPVDGGTVWFVSAHQFGLTLDDAGPGLAVIGATPANPGHPYGGAMAIVSTYGLDDNTFMRVRDRWSRWWRSQFPDSAEPVE